MRSLSKLVSLVLFTGGALACAGDPSVNVSLVVTISNGSTTSGEAGASGPTGSPGSGASDDDAGQAAPDGGVSGQGKADGANQDASQSSTCQLGPVCDTGTIIIEAGVNHCPEILPTTTTRIDATTSAIVLPAVDRDGDRLTYRWTASSGQFSDPSSFEPTYTCTMPGDQTLTVAVSDGQCEVMRDIQIVCP